VISTQLSKAVVYIDQIRLQTSDRLDYVKAMLVRNPQISILQDGFEPATLETLVYLLGQQDYLGRHAVKYFL